MSSNFLACIRGTWQCKNCGGIDWKWEHGRQSNTGFTKSTGVCLDCESKAVVKHHYADPSFVALLDWIAMKKVPGQSRPLAIREYANLRDFACSQSASQRSANEKRPGCEERR
jgi:hypothetical protein